MLEKRISPAELQEEKRTGQWRQNSTEESNKVRSSVPVVPAASFGSGWRSPAPVVEERNPRLAPWGEGNGEKFFAGRIWVAAVRSFLPSLLLSPVFPPAAIVLLWKRNSFY